jgi:endonuclease III
MREAEAWMQKFTRVLELCKRTKSKCETCPTSGMCVYFQEGWAKAL